MNNDDAITKDTLGGVDSTGLFAESPHNWPPLGIDDNDGYQNRCVSCEDLFWGHKHHVQCKKCHDEAKAAYDAMTDEEKQKHWQKVAEEVHAFYSANGQEEPRHE